MTVEIPADFIAVAIAELECPAEMALRVLHNFVLSRAWAEIEQQRTAPVLSEK